MNVAREKFLTDPAKVGMEIDKGAGTPTPKGWAIVTPRAWEFRETQICDKVQEVDGYGDPEWWIDMTKSYYMLLAWEKNPSISAADLGAEGYINAVDNQNIVIRPREVLVGNSANDPHGIVACAVETPWATNLDLYEEGRCYIWDAEKKKKVKVDEALMKRFEAFHKAKNHQFLIQSLVPEMIYNMYYGNFLRWWEPMGGIGARFNAGWSEWVFPQGNKGIAKECQKTFDRLTRESLDPKLPGEKYQELVTRANEMAACKRTVEAHIRWIKRHADKARELLKAEKDASERKRLERIAESCDWIAENPPRNLFDAVQLFEFWFEAGAHLETSVHSIAMRIDQVFWPYYKKDVLENKTLTRTEAGEIIAFSFFKMHEHGIPVSKHGVRLYGMGTRDYITLTIGGQIPETGEDAWNDLSDVVLDVVDGYRLHYPDVKIRWHQKTSRDVIKRGCEIARTGMGLPSFKNDEVAIKSILYNHGDETSLIEARDYAIVGCITPGIVRNSRDCNERVANFMNMTKILETVIWNGHDPMPGFEWVDINEYVPSKKTEDCATFEEFYAKWSENFLWFATMSAKLRNMARSIRKEAAKRTLCTAGNKKCVTQGLDVFDVDVPLFSFWDTLGIVDTADSLVAIKKLVYDDKKYTWKQLKQALKAQWEGYADMRQDFKNAPKFGNDDDYADEIMVRLCSDVADLSKEHCRDPRGQPIIPSALIVTTMYAAAGMVGALPNGRKTGEPLCDGCLNPHADFDKAGSWSRLRSALKIDQSKFRAWIYNQKVDYPTVEGEAGLEKFTDYVEAAMKSGEEQMQFNMMGRKALLDAKEHPEKYPHLSVRISGYSAYFTTLPEFVQDAVIARVEHRI